jgi:hypothetical protein
MLFNDLVSSIVRGISSVFEERDCDYVEGLPDRHIEIDGDFITWDISSAVVKNLDGSTLLGTDDERFSVSFRGAEIKVEKVFYPEAGIREIYIHAI